MSYFASVQILKRKDKFFRNEMQPEYAILITTNIILESLKVTKKHQETPFSQQ